MKIPRDLNIPSRNKDQAVRQDRGQVSENLLALPFSRVGVGVGFLVSFGLSYRILGLLITIRFNLSNRLAKHNLIHQTSGVTVLPDTLSYLGGEVNLAVANLDL